MKRIGLFLIVIFIAGSSFAARFLDMYYDGGSGPQIPATYYGSYIIVSGSGTIRIDYNAGGWLYRDIVTPGQPYYIPSNTTTIMLSNSASTSLYDIH